MNVKQLIELLQKEDPNTIILIASDEEGNSFGDIANDFSEHEYNGEKVLAIYPKNHIDGLEVE